MWRPKLSLKEIKCRWPEIGLKTSAMVSPFLLGAAFFPPTQSLYQLLKEYVIVLFTACSGARFGTNVPLDCCAPTISTKIITLR